MNAQHDVIRAWCASCGMPEPSNGECIALAVALIPAAQSAAPPVPAALENFPSYLLDHCEGETITEEGLQRWMSAMLQDPRYAAPAVQAEPATWTCQCVTTWPSNATYCRRCGQDKPGAALSDAAEVERLASRAGVFDVPKQGRMAALNWFTKGVHAATKPEPAAQSADPQPSGWIQCPECLVGFPLAEAIHNAQNDLTAAQSADAVDASLWRTLINLTGARRRIWNNVFDDEVRGKHNGIEKALAALQSAAQSEKDGK